MSGESRLSIEERQALHSGRYLESSDLRSPQKLRLLMGRMKLDVSQDVVDFGCGNAVLLDFVAERVGSYTGVDFSQDSIDAAMRRSARLGTENARFECRSLVDFASQHIAAFDVGFALDLSEHVYDEEWQDQVDAMFRVLKPGGRFYLHTPNADFLLEIMKRHDFILRQFPEHIAVRGAADNRRFLDRAGFRDIAVHFIPHYNLLRCLHPLSRLPGIGRYFEARLFIEARKPA